MWKYDFLAEAEPRLSNKVITGLPEKQRLLMEILACQGELTPGQIISRMEPTGYADRNNGVRSVNNILLRLMKDGFVERRKRCNSYAYSVSGRMHPLSVRGTIAHL